MSNERPKPSLPILQNYELGVGPTGLRGESKAPISDSSKEASEVNPPKRHPLAGIPKPKMERLNDNTFMFSGADGKPFSTTDYPESMRWTLDSEWVSRQGEILNRNFRRRQQVDRLRRWKAADPIGYRVAVGASKLIKQISKK